MVEKNTWGCFIDHHTSLDFVFKLSYNKRDAAFLIWRRFSYARGCGGDKEKVSFFFI